MPFLDAARWYEIHDAPLESLRERAAVFLDRDGVVIEEKHYLGDPDQVNILPGAAELLKFVRSCGVPVVLITNQSGIGNGYFTWDDYHQVQKRIVDLLGIERPFTAVYANSYASRESSASWRKPNPGMFLQAAIDLHLNLSASMMVGDKLVDIAAADDAGVKRLVHVRTGHGVGEREKVAATYPQAELLDSLADLVFDPVQCNRPSQKKK